MGQKALAQADNGFASSIKDAVKRDLLRLQEEENKRTALKTIYDFIIPNNPKCEPISGLHHFLGTAFVSMRIAQHLGLGEYGQATAFLGGLLHDYEKMGPEFQGGDVSFAGLVKKIVDYLDGTEVGEVIEEYLGSRFERAVEDSIRIAHTREGGGASRSLYLIRGAVEVGDILTGSKSSADVFMAESVVKERLRSVATVPVAVGASRPLASIASEKLTEILLERGALPLLSTGTGFLLLGDPERVVAEKDEVLRSLAQSIVREGRKALPLYKGLEEGKRTTRSNQKIQFEKIVEQVSGILEVGGNQKKSKNAKAIKYVPAWQIRKYLEANKDKDIEFRKAVLALIVVVAKQVHRKAGKEEIVRVARKIGIIKDSGNHQKILEQATAEGTLREIYSLLKKCDKKSLESFADKALEMLEKANEAEASVALDEDYIYSVVEETFSLPGYHSKLSKDAEKSKTVCSICRRPIPARIEKNSALARAFTLKTFLDRHKSRLGGIATSDLWHPDVQGMPSSPSAIDGLTKKLSMCPACFFEYVLYPYVSESVEGVWHVVLHYYPGASMDLLDVVKEAINEGGVYGGKVRWTVVDYMTSRIIIEPHVSSTELTTGILRAGLHFWYWYGGSALLTTAPYTAPPTNSPKPFELETSDVVIDSAVDAFLESLKNACRDVSYCSAQTFKLRKILYNQLKLYICALERAGKKRAVLTKTGLAPVRHPALEIVSFYLRNLRR